MTNFTLVQLQAGDVQITQDGSATTPSFTVVVTGQNPISSTPSTSTTQFTNTQGIIAPRLLRNYLKVTQGRSTLLDTQYLQASLGNGSAVDNSALFYVNGVSHGTITSIQDSSTSLPFFSQGDLQSGAVQFTHDGSPSLPAYQLAVQAQGLRSANMPASIFFQTVPYLANPLTEQSAVIGQPFTYVIPSNTFRSSYGQPLNLSASMFNASQTLPLTFDPTNNRFTGTFTRTGLYDIAVTATDPFNFTASTDFVVRALPAPTKDANLSKVIVGAVIPGAISLGFFCVKTALQYVAHKKLKEGRGEFDRKVVSPIAKAIADRVKVLGPFAKTNTQAVEDFKGAVRSLIAEIETRGINVNAIVDTPDDPAQRDALINEIATQTKFHLVGKSSCCTSVSSFFKAATSPADLRQKVSIIADSVATVHSRRYGQEIAMIGLSTGRESRASQSSSHEPEIDMRALGF
jgi:hypothetical protein